MLLVAFSRRMCCSRVCSVRTKQRLPRRSTVWPAMRPGMRRTNFSRQAMMPRYGPPYGIGVPSEWPSATAMSAPQSPGRFSRPRLIGSNAATTSAPASWAILASASASSRQPKKFGCWTRTQAVWSSTAAARSCGCTTPPGVPTVTSSTPRLARYVAIVWRYSGCTLAAATTLPWRPVRAHGHQHGLGRGAAAVVEAGVRDVHAGELRDQRLILEHDLQVALADLGLVGRVRRVELAAAGELVDDGGDEMVVAAAAEEADLLAGVRVLGRQLRPCAASAPSRSCAGGIASGRLSRSSAGIIANSSSIEPTPIAASIAAWSSGVL